jgi:hypothetical protein
MIPSVISPNCGSPGEHEIFRKLATDSSTGDWIVLHSLDISDHTTQISGEVDFVVIVPGKGVLCLEVKSHRRVSRDSVTRLWYLGNKKEARGPFKQASEATHSLRNMVTKADPRLSKIVFWSAVVLPFSEFNTTSPEWHSWQVIDKYLYRQAPFSSLVESIFDKARDFLKSHQQAAPWFHPERKEPSKEQCEALLSILRPSFEYINSFRSQRETLDSELRYYTEEQFDALDALEAEPRISFEGPAGTGKTLIAVEAARRSKTCGNKVLLLCFNRLLGKWLEKQTIDLQPEVTTRTLHKHMLEVAGKDLVEDSSGDTFWQHDLPIAAAESLLDSEGDQFIFDEIIIDEAQDIIWNDCYLDFLQFSLKGEFNEGKWVLFGDYEKQALYTDKGIRPPDALKSRGFPPAHFFTYKLTKNCRNTPRIAEAVRILGRLQPGYKKILRPDNGIEPKYLFYKSDKDQISWLADILDRLIQEGFRGDDIVILSKKAGTDCAASKLNQTHWNGKLKPFGLATKGQIAYGSIYSFKGLESPVVIVTDIDSTVSDEDQNLFYVGITRAVNNLILLAQVKVKQEIGRLLNK